MDFQYESDRVVAKNTTLQTNLSKGGQLALGDKLGKHKIRVHLKSWGRGDALGFKPTKQSKGQIKGARVEYTHAHGLREWYENKPAGLEHGFVLSKQPKGTTPLAFALSIEGGKIDTVSPKSITVRTEQGALKYDKLKVWDANQKTLAARMVRGAQNDIQIIVNDQNAVYPITIDPTWTVETISPTKVSTNAQFGFAVATHENVAVVGAPYDNIDGIVQGSAYIYELVDTHWRIATRVTAPVATANGLMGANVAVHNGRVIVSKPGVDASSLGEVYVYEKFDGRWLKTATIKNPSNRPGERFGRALAIEDDTIFIGAHRYSGVLVESGALYVFEYDSSGAIWNQQTKLEAPTPANDILFGRNIALAANNLFVTIENGSNRQVLVYQKGANQWRYEQTLAVPSVVGNQSSDYGGDGMFIDKTGKWAVVGASNAGLINEGSVVVYKNTNNTWGDGVVVSLTRPEQDGEFGYSAAIKDDGVNPPYLMVSSRNVGTLSVFKYENNTWKLLNTLRPGNSEPQDLYGQAIAMDEYLMVGVPRKNVEVSREGYVAVYSLEADGVKSTTSNLFGDEALSFFQRYGQSISTHNDTMIIGAPGRPNKEPSAGMVYVVERKGQALQIVDRFGAQTPFDSAHFGESTSLFKNRLVIGAPGDQGSGSAFVYERTPGEYFKIQQELIRPTDDESDNFGQSIAQFDDLIAVGAASGFATGSVHLFEFNNTEWKHSQKLVPTPSEDNDLFGQAIATLDGKIYIGAPGAFEGTGAVFVFEKNQAGWTQTQSIKLDDSERASSPRFGWALDVNQVHLAIGAPDDETPGSVYVYSHDGTKWANPQQIQGSLSSRDDNFGYALKLKGNRLAIGSPGQNHEMLDASGRIYTFLFKTDTWTEEAVDGKFEDIFRSNRLGQSVVWTSKSTLLVGAPQTQKGHVLSGIGDTGEVFLFDTKVSNNTPPAAYETEFKVQKNEIFVAKNFGYDLEGDDVTITPTQVPTNGNLDVNDANGFTLTPDKDYVGLISFSLKLDDGDVSTTVMVTVEITDMVVINDDYKITQPKQNEEFTNDGQITIQGTAPQGVVMNLVVEDMFFENMEVFRKNGVDIQQGQFSVKTTTLPNSQYRIKLIVDEETKATSTFLVKKFNGTVTVEVNPDGTFDIPAGQSIIIKGTAEPNSTVTIYLDGEKIDTIQADTNGNWQYTIPADIAEQVGEGKRILEIEFESKDKKSKARVRLRVNTSRYNPKDFLRQGCAQSGPHNAPPFGLFGLMVLGIGFIRRKKGARVF